MFDKGWMGDNPAKFTAELVEQIKNVISFPIKKDKPSISLLELWERNISKLKSIDNYLFEYLNSNVFSPFEKIDSTTENNLSFSIVIKSGIIVEYLIEGFSMMTISETTKKKLSSLSDLSALKAQPRESEKTIREKLMGLTGRKSEYRTEKDFRGKERPIEYFVGNGSTVKLTRQAADFANIAYRIRSDASHTGEADARNRNIFSDNAFTKEHALTSISLVMPIIQDYIKYKSK